jgi:hypothetical protein
MANAKNRKFRGEGTWSIVQALHNVRRGRQRNYRALEKERLATLQASLLIGSDNESDARYARQLDYAIHNLTIGKELGYQQMVLEKLLK